MPIDIILRNVNTLEEVAASKVESYSTKLSRLNVAVRIAEENDIDKYNQYDLEVLERENGEIIDRYELRPYRY